DNDLVRRFTVRMLGTAGYQTREAATVESALALLADADLLLSDLAISGQMIGADLVRSAQRERSDLKVVLTTGHAPETLAHEGVDTEGLVVLYKPYTKQQLLSAVREAFDGEPVVGEKRQLSGGLERWSS